MIYENNKNIIIYNKKTITVNNIVYTVLFITNSLYIDSCWLNSYKSEIFILINLGKYSS